MKTKDIEVFSRYKDFYEAMMGPGAFLSVKDKNGRVNVMTIGWAMLGVLWYEPVMTVLVRPSRHTFDLLENSRYFSVSIPVGKMRKELSYCGSHTGKDEDKIHGCGLKLANGKTEGIVAVEGCDIYFECEVVHKNALVKENLEPAILGKYYGGGSLHILFYGKVIRSYEKI